MNRRRYRRRTCCDGKKRHRNWAAAEAHRDRLLTEGRAPMDIYRCRHCGHIHVGHQFKTR